MKKILMIEAFENESNVGDADGEYYRSIRKGSIVGDVGSADGVYCCSVLRVLRFMQLLNFRCPDY
jgi:hypothetical protein